ncbi:transmembrane protein 231 [Schistocerca cancellata]|uniref:transmembrane protein 231 n=1 Tax=Schistocerca cancellata TaxID=274614 RepID=UPI002117C08C|nr:transmembrane protein 231 [Schistocerca cancellata]
MAVYNVLTQNVVCTYRATVCSKATVFVLFITGTTVIIPLIIAYRSYGFWIKADTYREQPDVHFKHKFIAVAESNQLDKPIICSNFWNLNSILSDYSHCSVVKTREEDRDIDGKNELLFFEMELLLHRTEAVFSLILFLVFDYKLYKYSAFQMESLAIIQHSSSLPGARFDIVGDLKLVQKQPLFHDGRDVSFNYSCIDEESTDPQVFNLQKIIKEYVARNVSTAVTNAYPLWTVGRAAGAPFVISATIYYPEDTILYKPGFWQVVKWAWVQYLSVLVVIMYITNKIKAYVFGNHLISSFRIVPWKKDV